MRSSEFIATSGFHNQQLGIAAPLCRQDFHFDLPPALIAQQPLAERSASRLLIIDGNAPLRDGQFSDLPQLLRPGDLLVCNDTQVIPARLCGRKASGGRVELLMERLLDERHALVQIRASKAPQPGTQLHFAAGASASVVRREVDLFVVRLDGALAWLPLLEAQGHTPLPPYISRAPDAADRERYQTVYAREPGAVAAPTAGLHFDSALLEQLETLGVERAFLTLHVGAGTFKPLRVDALNEHVMHAERIAVSAQVGEQIRETKARGGRVIAVGTTVTRALESVADESGKVRAFCGETRIFIYPGYRFRCVDALITNFHLPQSTLLMLVAAFAGLDTTMAAYRHAVAQHYRFFSYGDAMLIAQRAPGCP